MVATVAIFTPIFLGVVLPGPWFIRHRDNPQIKAFVKGATAAGAIADAEVVLSRQTIRDWPTVALAVVTLAVLLRFKVEEPYVVATGHRRDGLALAVLIRENVRECVVGRADVYVQPDAADPVLMPQTVLGLLRAHVPVAGQVTGIDESGGEARVYLVDADVAVKTQRPHRLRPRTSLAKEAYLLDALAPVLGPRIPRLLGYDTVQTPDGPVEYLCLSRVSGVAARSTVVPDHQRPVVLGEVGRLLRTLHEQPVRADVVPADRDAAAVRQRLTDGFGDIADAVAERAPSWPPSATVDEIAERALAALPAAFDQPVVLHSNPGPTHVFVDPGTHRFTGVIDFGDAYASHPALDLHRWPDPADRIALRDAYLDGDTPSNGFRRMWTIVMIYTDLAVIAAGSPHADHAAADLTMRLGEL